MLGAITPTILLCSFHDKFLPSHLSPHCCHLIGEWCLLGIPGLKAMKLLRSQMTLHLLTTLMWQSPFLHVLCQPLILGSLVTSENHKVYMVPSESFYTSCVYKGLGTMFHFCVFVQALPIHTCAHTHAGTQIHSCVKTDKDIPKDKVDNWWLEGVVWISHPSSQCLSCPRSSPVAEIQVTNYPNSEQGKTN